jgi:transcriptional regulator with XRE-family HTH domain
MTTEHADLGIYPEDQEWVREQIDNLTFGDIIKAHRLCEGWTQEEAASRLGVSKQMLSAYENGRKLPSLRKAYEIGEKLGMLPASAVWAVINDQLREAEIPLQAEVKMVS